MTLQTHSDAAPIPPGIPGLDDILAGGYAGNRAHLIEGRPGSGKTTAGMQFLLVGAEQGETCLYIALSESERELLSVASRRGWSLEGIEIFERVPSELSLDPQQQQSPVHASDLELGETVHMAPAEIERVEPSRVVVDSLTGYLNAMPEQPFIVLQMHELLTYLNQQSVVTILILAQHGMVGQMVSPVDLTYLSDAVVLLRFFEADRRIRRALSVVKRRTGPHEETIREFRIDSQGLRVGPPLEQFRGVLTDVRTFEGQRASLLEERETDNDAGR
ncbi:ATPase domain-containing protein [Microvirga sp. TS319]|uniref:ATPase domain-containing protein n=1 Tax=Microvirga sp. TS319 TaxID=3241165 RepID=UPI00351A6783